jgi:hypothetical protein
MPTVLEVVDTAVKVGLGALITALAGYVSAQRSFSNEREKERRKWRSDLLREALLKLEQCGTVLNDTESDARHAFLEQVSERSKKMSALAKQSLSAYNLCRESRTLALLAGHTVLGDLISEYSIAIAPLHDLYLYESPETIVRDSQTLYDKRTAAKTKIVELTPSLL